MKRSIILSVFLFLPVPVMAQTCSSFAGTVTCTHQGNRWTMQSGPFSGSPDRIRGTTSNGAEFNGTIDRNGNFNGDVNGKYQMCNRFGCF